jgi:hypothetical protein
MRLVFWIPHSEFPLADSGKPVIQASTGRGVRVHVSSDAENIRTVVIKYRGGDHPLLVVIYVNVADMAAASAAKEPLTGRR